MMLHVWHRMGHCCYRCIKCQLIVPTLRDRPPPRRFDGGCRPNTEQQDKLKNCHNAERK